MEHKYKHRDLLNRGLKNS